MPNSVLTRGRRIVARLTALAMVASIMVIGAVPASAAPVDTSATCPSSTPSAGFVDIGAYTASTQLAINCLVDYGISNGTSATTYSPEMEVSRWQMALFLTRQAEVHGLTLGDGSDQGFTDIGAYPASTQVAINQLAQLGVTTGTTATTFSPAAAVPRWQMALFLTRVLDAAGFTLGDGSSQGFTDIGDYPASTQVAINQIAQAGVSEGFTATTFGPGTNTTRVQMAIFLTRTLAADGIIPTGNYFYITAWADGTTTNTVTYSDGVSTTSTYTYADTGAKSLNGVAVSNALYESALGQLDTTLTAAVTARQIDPATGDVKTNVNATAGLIGATNAATTYAIVDPATGAGIGFATYAQTYDTYVVDGAASSLVVFNVNVSVGDTVVATGGDGTSAAQARSIALTNGTASGTVTGTTPVVIGVLTVPDPIAGDSVTIDGAADTAANFLLEVSAGDSATYSMAAGVETYTLTNNAPAPVTGTTNGVFAANNSIDWDAGAGVVTLAYVDTTTATFVVDGVVTTIGALEGEISAGDVIVYTAPDGPSSQTERVELTNSVITNMTLRPSTVVVGSDLLNVWDSVETSSFLSPDVVYTGIPLGYSPDGAPEYTVNGAAATETEFESALGAVASGFVTGTLTVADGGTNAVVYHLTTS